MVFGSFLTCNEVRNYYCAAFAKPSYCCSVYRNTSTPNELAMSFAFKDALQTHCCVDGLVELGGYFPNSSSINGFIQI